MNKAPTLLGPTARPMVALGGANAWRTRRIKDVYCSFQWLDLRQWGFENTPDHACVPCMCLFRPTNTGRGAYVIPQAHAFLFGTRAGHPTNHLLTSAFQIAEDLGFDMRDKHAIRQCIDVVIEGLPDLVLMPTEPPNTTEILVEQAVHGIEATARINGRKVHEELL